MNNSLSIQFDNKPKLNINKIINTLKCIYKCVKVKYYTYQKENGKKIVCCNKFFKYQDVVKGKKYMYQNCNQEIWFYKKCYL